MLQSIHFLFFAGLLGPLKGRSNSTLVLFRLWDHLRAGQSDYVSDFRLWVNPWVHLRAGQSHGSTLRAGQSDLVTLGQSTHGSDFDSGSVNPWVRFRPWVNLRAGQSDLVTLGQSTHGSDFRLWVSQPMGQIFDSGST